MLTGLFFGMVISTMSEQTGSLGDGPGVELTIYNGGFALVKEQRVLDLVAGRQTVPVVDVAELIEADSVGIRSLSAPGSFTVLEQNYQYDLVSPMAVLAKAVGQTVVFNRVLPNGERERLEGVLLSAPTAVVSAGDGRSVTTWNGMVVQLRDGRIILNPSGEVEVAGLPEGLISRPTLVWLLDSRAAGRNRVELSYITQGMGWKSDYVLSLDGSGQSGDLKGWVTLTNNSGATWRGARLKLLAGDVMRAQPERGVMPGNMMRAAAAGADKAFEQEAFADYHLYTLQRETDVRNREMKQVSLMEAFSVPVRKRLVVEALRGFGRMLPSEGEVGTGPIKPLVQVEFKNDAASRLGVPLPAGTVKVFQRDSGGSLQLLGEDRIAHTPREELVRLTVGRAFDVVAERRRTEFRWLGGPQRREGVVETFEFEIRNRKETAETVTVIERAGGQNRILRADIQPRQLDAGTYEFVVELKAGETRTFSYTIETRY